MTQSVHKSLGNSIYLIIFMINNHDYFQNDAICMFLIIYKLPMGIKFEKWPKSNYANLFYSVKYLFIKFSIPVVLLLTTGLKKYCRGLRIIHLGIFRYTGFT